MRQFPGLDLRLRRRLAGGLVSVTYLAGLSGLPFQGSGAREQ